MIGTTTRCVVAPPQPTMRPRRSSSTPNLQLTVPPQRSVKHMTCAYWASGHCKWSAADCKYAHRDTGIKADKPVTVEKGGPALAGRNLRSALSQRSSGQSTPERALSRQDWRTHSRHTSIASGPHIPVVEAWERRQTTQGNSKGTYHASGAGVNTAPVLYLGPLADLFSGEDMVRLAEALRCIRDTTTQLASLQTSITSLSQALETIFTREREGRPAPRYVRKVYSRETFEEAFKEVLNFVEHLSLIDIPDMMAPLQNLALQPTPEMLAKLPES